jgi:hypothetical protein
MITTKKLNELSNIISIKKLCRASDLDYYTIVHKIHRYRANPNNGELTKEDSDALLRGLSQYELFLCHQFKEQHLRRFAEKKIEELRKELKKWHLFLSALEEEEPQQKVFTFNETNQTVNKNLQIQKRIKENPATLRERCEKILYDMDVPLTTRELMNEVKSRYKKQYGFSAFSGSFSQSYRRKGSLIAKYDLPNASMEFKAVYCLKNWYDVTGKLSQEYRDKIKERYLV